MGRADFFMDGEVIGLEQDGSLIQWSDKERQPVTNGQTLEEFGIANLSPIERARVGLGQERYEYTDPFPDAKYSFDTIEQMISKCDELGASRFQAIRHDSSFIQVNKVDGVWEREDDPLVIRRQAEAGALVLAADLESRIRAELKEDLHDISRMPSEVRMACREMGVDPHEDAEKCAMQGIEARSMAYGDAVATAKGAKIDGHLGLNARLRAMRMMEVTVLSPEVARMWAELDLRDFLKIQMSPHRKEDAGLLLATNMAANAEYKAALIEKNPSIAAMAMALDAENDRLIAAKEQKEGGRYEKICGVDYVITKNNVSGMVGLSRVGESFITEFGGIPAIQNFAKENPEVPGRVINELLARDGGYTGIERDDAPERSDTGSFFEVRHPDRDRVIVRTTIDEAWAAAALNAVRYVAKYEETECVPSCRP